MAIHPELRDLYLENWPAISKRTRFERAGGRCEWCEVENYKPFSAGQAISAPRGEAED